MPTVSFADARVECLAGSNLRMVLLRARLPLYASVAAALNCRGNGARCRGATARVLLRRRAQRSRPSLLVRLD